MIRRQKCRKKESKSGANFLHKDSGLTVVKEMRKRRGTRTPTGADSPLAGWDTADTAVWPMFGSSSGSGRTGPRYRDLLQQQRHEPRPRPPSELMSGGRKFLSQWWLRRCWKLGARAESLWRHNLPRLLRAVKKKRLIPLCRLEALLGSQGGGTLTLQAG